MSRFFAFAVGTLAVSLGLIAWTSVGCSSSSLEPIGEAADASPVPPRRDSAPVDPPSAEAGSLVVEAGLTVPTSCKKYCDLVMSNCTGDNAQYASLADCVAFCTVLPLTQPKGEGVEKAAASVACRQYWADSPAHTNPKAYCLTAGPFGGNVCGDRCTAFCDVLLSTCSPDGGIAAYESAPECANACANFSYLDAGADGGGEGPLGPKEGDSLNCRLFHLRAAALGPQSCTKLVPDGGLCN